LKVLQQKKEHHRGIILTPTTEVVAGPEDATILMEILTNIMFLDIIHRPVFA
jgi:hypothetical protein